MFLDVEGWLSWWIDRAARVHQGCAPRQRTISRGGWIGEVVAAVVGFALVVMFLLFLWHDGEWTMVPDAVVFGLLASGGLVEACRLRVVR